MNHRSSFESALDDIKTGAVMLPRDKPIGSLLTGWAVSGIEMARAWSGLLCETAGTCVAMLRETAKKSPFKAQSTEAQRRGGLTHSSDEGFVMDLEPRSQVVLPKTSPTRKGRSG